MSFPYTNEPWIGNSAHAAMKRRLICTQKNLAYATDQEEAAYLLLESRTSWSPEQSYSVLQGVISVAMVTAVLDTPTVLLHFKSVMLCLTCCGGMAIQLRRLELLLLQQATWRKSEGIKDRTCSRHAKTLGI